MDFGARLFTTVALCCLALAIVLVWRIGPVVLSVTPEHGLHLGDLLALPALSLAGVLQVRPVLRLLPVRAR
jgi:hypothetical protein